LYRSMDLEGKGYCSAFDIAGGDHADFKVRLRNTIDEASVKLILGDQPIGLQQFMELMCEDGFRGTDSTIHAKTEHGRPIVRYTSDVVGFQAWIFVDAPPEQVEQVKKAKALENEVRQWRAQAAAKARARAVAAAEAAVAWE